MQCGLGLPGALGGARLDHCVDSLHEREALLAARKVLLCRGPDAQHHELHLRSTAQIDRDALPGAEIGTLREARAEPSRVGREQLEYRVFRATRSPAKICNRHALPPWTTRSWKAGSGPLAAPARRNRSAG